jgi:hypothetical protein
MPATARFSSIEEAGEAFKRALPDFRCPACRHDRFLVADQFDQGLRTRMNFYRGNNGVPTQGVATLSLVCDNCGFVSSFEERTLKKLADKSGSVANG